MPLGIRTQYFFYGRHPVETAGSLEEALRNLIDWWVRQPTLVAHEMGSMVIELSIGSTAVKVEVTDPTVLDDTRYLGPTAMLEYLAQQMGIDVRDARELLEASTATVEVDTLRVPNEPNAWQTDPTLEPTSNLTAAVPDLVASLVRQRDVGIRRDKGRPRSARGRAVVDLAARAQVRLGLSAAEMSSKTGIPRSTLHDASERVARLDKAKATLGTRSPRSRLTPDQVDAIRSELQRNKGNATETARQLGLAPRTVRDLRARVARGPSERPSAEQRDKLLEIVKTERVSSTEAGRRLGISGRTARGWVRKARLDSD